MRDFRMDTGAHFGLFPRLQDKVNHFWVVAKKQLEEERARLRNLDREIQDLEEKHGVEVKVSLPAWQAALVTAGRDTAPALACADLQATCEALAVRAPE